MIPFIPLQYLNFKTSLTMEQALAILGRSVEPKPQGNETISFKYHPQHSYHIKSDVYAGTTVYVRYKRVNNIVQVRVVIMPAYLPSFFFILAFGTISQSYGTSTKHEFELWLLIILVFFYLLLWWETVDTRNAIKSLFRDVVTE